MSKIIIIHILMILQVLFTFELSRMTPEDLTAIGIKNPAHRKKLKSEISKLSIGDGIPNHVPVRKSQLFSFYLSEKLHVINSCKRGNIFCLWSRMLSGSVINTE